MAISPSYRSTALLLQDPLPVHRVLHLLRGTESRAGGGRKGYVRCPTSPGQDSAQRPWVCPGRCGVGEEKGPVSGCRWSSGDSPAPPGPAGADPARPVAPPPCSANQGAAQASARETSDLPPALPLGREECGCCGHLQLASVLLPTLLEGFLLLLLLLLQRFLRDKCWVRPHPSPEDATAGEGCDGSTGLRTGRGHSCRGHRLPLGGTRERPILGCAVCAMDRRAHLI